jgi:hypothetical protein
MARILMQYRISGKLFVDSNFVLHILENLLKWHHSSKTPRRVPAGQQRRTSNRAISASSISLKRGYSVDE